MALAFRPEVINQPIDPSVHFWRAAAVIRTGTAAESPTTTPPPVAKAFVRVLVGFGGGRSAVWWLSAMVGVVEVSKFGVKMVPWA